MCLDLVFRDPLEVKMYPPNSPHARYLIGFRGFSLDQGKLKAPYRDFPYTPKLEAGDLTLTAKTCEQPVRHIVDLQDGEQIYHHNFRIHTELTMHFSLPFGGVLGHLSIRRNSIYIPLLVPLEMLQLFSVGYAGEFTAFSCILPDHAQMHKILLHLGAELTPPSPLRESFLLPYRELYDTLYTQAREEN